MSDVISAETDPPEVTEHTIKKPPKQFTVDPNGLEVVVLNNPRGFSAQVHLYGGHVTSWKDDHGEDLLFMSSKAIFKPPKPIRGGIPICFPQFSNMGSTGQHGFARNRYWTVDANPHPLPRCSDDEATVDLILKPTEEDKKTRYHSFEFRLRVSLGPEGELDITARVRNYEKKPLFFTIALHTYFSVSDISEVRVEGLETLNYLDNLQNRKTFTEQGDALTFEGEFDRVYLNTPTKIALIDHGKKRTFVLKKEGFPDAVVWNPWDKKARAMADFGDDEYKHMLCIEPAAIEEPISVVDRDEWTGRLTICTVCSSYHSGRLDPGKVLDNLTNI